VLSRSPILRLALVLLVILVVVGLMVTSFPPGVAK
jgi:hypothetical protein